MWLRSGEAVTLVSANPLPMTRAPDWSVWPQCSFNRKAVPLISTNPLPVTSAPGIFAPRRPNFGKALSLVSANPFPVMRGPWNIVKAVPLVSANPLPVTRPTWNFWPRDEAVPLRLVSANPLPVTRAPGTFSPMWLKSREAVPSSARAPFQWRDFPEVFLPWAG